MKGIAGMKYMYEENSLHISIIYSVINTACQKITEANLMH